MPLLDIELKAQKLKENLSKPISVHLKLKLLSKFFHLFIEEDVRIYQSFYFQFQNDFDELVLKNSFDYFSPDEIDDLIRIAEKYKSVSCCETNPDTLVVLREAKNNIFACLSKNKNTEEDSETNLNAVNIVLLETENNDKDFCGRVERLNLDFYRKRNGENSSVSIHNFIEDPHNKIQQEIKNILTMLECKINAASKNKIFLNIIIAFENNVNCYKGTSFAIGAAALIFNSFLQAKLNSIYYKFRNDCVMTGCIDEFGNLTKLDSSILVKKLHTVFYSKYKKFVIPEENFSEAYEELRKLKIKFPNRELKLIPLEKYSDLFTNLEIVEIIRLKLRNKIKANYTQYHNYVNIFLSLLILVILIVLATNYVIPALDDNPVSAGIVEDQFVAFNKYGKAIWKSGLLNECEKKTVQIPSLRDHRIIVNDIDNDGNNEILYLRSDDNNSINNRTLFCLTGKDGIKWKFIAPKMPEYYGNEECSDKTQLMSINIFYNKVTGRKEIILNGHVCELFPAYLFVVDFRGKLISEYYHPGAIHYVKCIDIDSDGKDEIIFDGVNNDFDKHAFIAVIDPNNLEGSAPGRRLPPNVMISKINKYILLPKTDICKFTASVQSEAGLFEYNGKLLSVYVNENNLYDVLKPLSNENAPLSVIFTFDRYMNPVSFGTSSEWDGRYNELLAEGKIKPITDWKEYKDSILGEIKYWDGDKFVKYSEMKNYQLQIKEQHNSKFSTR